MTVSDCHNIIRTCLNCEVPSDIKQKHSYRSFKKFDEEVFCNELESIPIPCLENLSEQENIINVVNETYNTFEKRVINIVDKHAPMKERYERKQQCPFMNKELRKAICRKHMLLNKYPKYKCNRTWEDYRVQRNLVNKIKRKSMSTYFLERCAGGSKSSDFWNTIKPYISNKSTSKNNKIILNENGNLVSETENITEIFNDFFVHVADNIGTGQSFDPENHPSIMKIKENQKSDEIFEFKPVSESDITKIIDKMNVKKAVGVDKLSVKLLQAGKSSLVTPITSLVNTTLATSIFPDRLKEAQVTPLYKKCDPLIKKNYRPVSVLTNVFKIYERVICNQLCQHFETIFHDFLCAFRKGHGCQTVLLRVLEDLRQALDNNLYTAAILMDLSKAFDCLPNNILLEKLSAYGLSSNSVKLFSSYLSNRKQQIKIGNIVSSWVNITNGVPQGSVLGPILFNVFINDIFYFIKHGKLYNYADDNTLSFSCPDFGNLMKCLVEDSKTLIDWFDINWMQANPEKFQALAIGKKTFDKKPVFEINDVKISCDETVKLLGVEIDYLLKFDSHISSICRKAAQQINILKRLGKYLTKLNKLTIFHTFIVSNFNYCPLSWHFCSERNTKKLEKLQERALRFVYDDHTSTYDDLLDRAKIPSLKLRRIKTMAIEAFKIIHGTAPPCLHDCLSLKESRYKELCLFVNLEYR